MRRDCMPGVPEEGPCASGETVRIVSMNGIDGRRKAFRCPACRKRFTYWRPEALPGAKMMCYYCGAVVDDDAARRPPLPSAAPPPPPAAAAVPSS